MTSEPVNVFDFEELARAKMEPSAYEYFAGGAEDEVTLRANRSAFEKIFLCPRYLVDVSKRDHATSVLGQSISLPVLLAPTGYQRLAHPDGELATARAASASGTIMVVSTVSTYSLEEIAAAATRPLWFQLYSYKDRRINERLIRRAEQADYRALCLTIDVPVLARRERDLRNNFALPKDMKASILADMELGVESQLRKSSGRASYSGLAFDAALTWDDVDWMRTVTEMPLVLKGVLAPADARLAVEHGVAGIIVSNHGGRQLDGVPAAIDLLPEIVAEVGGEIEIYLDSGVRRGTDILKALALGAKAVMIGRPFLWGLAVDGEAGVCRVLELLRHELDTALGLVGRCSVAEIDASILFQKK
jgi:isopentenyl diphosphate isomerase/L-lactate dehydrogenase-like FMN-dependent dehydrogenase